MTGGFCAPHVAREKEPSMKCIIAPIVAVLAVLWAAMPALAANAPAGYKTFTSRTNHYRIAYPGAWQAKANSSGQQFFYGNRVAGFKTNVNVYLVSSNRRMSLDTLGKAIAQADRNAGAQVSSVTSGRVGSITSRTVFGSFKKKVSGHVVT